MRHLGELLTDGANDGIGVCMLMFTDSFEHRDSLFRHTKGAVPQCCSRLRFVSMLLLSHGFSLPPFLESVKEACRRGGHVAKRTGIGFDQMYWAAIF